MALILNIETSTEVCSVVIARDGAVIQSRENLTGQNHAMMVTVFIRELLTDSNLTMEQLDAVAVSGGPGSYTGLRIGVSVAKGLCYASRLPLIAITSLEAMALHVINNHEKFHYPETGNPLFCPMIDARRMEVYTSFYDANGIQIRGIQADIIDNQSYLPFLENNTVLFFGNGAAKCRNAISHPNAIFIDGIITSAENMVPLAERDFKNQKFVDMAYYEPFYLKDFVATIPVKNIFKCIKF
ncbi:MAG: tRNA (adenosine(37)-N6)-threonylcarbamoyltransferase complex dimerization subunit type 1 TsaB [Bacteroidia bacterium]|nr:tRNA (adenosine(37)-N6)-threonylcarbamoyltransferase complex dimerization subunit type 1 TsaB [Bacteroidia bacterium]